MRPILGFILGVLLGETYQWGQWIARNQGKPKSGYWAAGLPHLMMNIIVIVGVGVLWSMGLLDDTVNLLLPSALTGEWANVGIPYTPQVGLAVGAGSDLVGDQIAYMVRVLAGKKFPWLAPSQPPAGGGGNP